MPLKLRLYHILRKVIIAFIMALIVNFVFSYFFHTPKVFSLSKQNNELLIKYKLLLNSVKQQQARLDEVKNRDNGIYRAMLGLDTTTIDMKNTYLFEDNYIDYEGNRYDYVVKQTWDELNKFKSDVYLQSLSLDTIQVLAKDKEKMVGALPTIWPMDRTKLRGKIGAFGFRTHPILRIRMGHEGVDLAGPVGLPIYSTADGKVVAAGRESGYGLTVVVDHGYGYKTRYAHLSKIRVEKGQQVRRGERVGDLGNTGRSTGPHLHYEVLYRNRPVNPINYLGRDMSKDDYRKIIESVEETTYEK